MNARQNILGLLGRDNRKYHSCIITSYSFDFLFFEQRVLPALHGAGITNINLFLDAAMLNKQLEVSDGRHLHAKKSYSIIPVYMAGAFHPKVLLAIGKKWGFMGVGSGNFTSSGINSNDEIWAAFMMQEENDHILPFFRYIADYLFRLQSLSLAINSRKFTWITENAKWYDTLLKMPISDPFIERKGESFQILGTNADHSIYGELMAQLPSNPDCIKILSPFYNEKGTLIENLCRDLHPTLVHCIVDPKFGSVPFKCDRQLPVIYSDWNLLEKEERYRKARLHAKAIQFEYSDRTYFLFGSPNATVEAMGTLSDVSHNAEVAILMNIQGIRDYFTDLGIHFPANGNYELKNYEPRDNYAFKTTDDRQLSIRLLHVEWEAGDLSVYSTYEQEENEVRLQIFDANGTILYISNPLTLKQQLIIEIPERVVKDLFKVAFFKEMKQVSNFALIHRIDLLNPTNPDTRLARFNELLNSEQFSDMDLYELLEYAHFKSHATGHTSKGLKEHTHDEQETEIPPPKLSENEFNLLAGELDSRYLLRWKEMAMLEEFLNNLSFGKSLEIDDVLDSEESVALNAGDGGFKNENDTKNKPRIQLSFEQGQRLKNRIHNTLNRITESLTWNKNKFAEVICHQKEYPVKASMEQIQSLLIGCHLILMKRSKSYTEQRCLFRIEFNDKNALPKIEAELLLHRLEDQHNNSFNQVSYTIDEQNASRAASVIQHSIGFKLLYIDGTPSQIIEHSYFEFKTWPEIDRQSAAEKFLSDGVGSFLLCMLNGNEQYIGKDLKKWEQYKERLLYRFIICLITYRWKDKTEDIKELLLLNMFYVLCPDEFNEEMLEMNLTNFAEVIKMNLALEETSLRYPLNIFRMFRHWSSIYNQDASQLKETLDKWKIGRIIFNKRFGFSRIEHFYSDFLVNLETPLGVKHKDISLCGFKKVFIGKSPVFYNR